MTAVRVALLGCGRIARIFHLALLQRLDGCELAAIADAEPARLADARAAAPGAAAFTDYERLLAEAEVDAVVVALPTSLHAAATVAALERGMHVYVEKPLAPTAAEAAPVLDAWRDARTVGAVGYVFRFHPVYRALAADIAAGRAGEVVAVRTSFAASARELPAWKRRRATGGGALVDLASHHVDLVRFLFGREVAEARASIAGVRTEDDTVLLELALDGGPLVQAFASSSAVQEDRVEVYGTAGKLVADRYARAPELVPAGAPSSRGARVARTVRLARRSLGALRRELLPPAEPAFAAALTSFVRAAAGAAPFDGATLDDGHRALLVVEAAEQAARSGGRVPVPVRAGLP